jgi:hypothetical protein
MQRVFLTSILSVVLTAAGAAQAEPTDLNQILRGDYALTGTDRCINSPAGFNANLTPKGPSSGVTSSVQTLSTFNGDGTGTAHGHSVTILDPPGAPSSTDFSFAFTYDVAPDGTVTVENGLLTGTILTGPAAGETFTIDHTNTVGHISEDHKTLTLATDTPAPEVETFSTGFVLPRICARSRAVIKLDD